MIFTFYNNKEVNKRRNTFQLVIYFEIVLFLNVNVPGSKALSIAHKNACDSKNKKVLIFFNSPLRYILSSIGFF